MPKGRAFLKIYVDPPRGMSMIPRTKLYLMQCGEILNRSRVLFYIRKMPKGRAFLKIYVDPPRGMSMIPRTKLYLMRVWRNGRRAGFKIRFPLEVRVRVSPPAPSYTHRPEFGLKARMEALLREFENLHFAHMAISLKMPISALIFCD